MTTNDNVGSLDSSEIDLTSVVRYMQRNNLTSVKLHIQAVNDVPTPGAEGTVLVRQRRDMVDDASPSELGLDGVFFIASS